LFAIRNVDLSQVTVGTLIVAVIEDQEIQEIYEQDIINKIINEHKSIPEFPKEKKEQLILYKVPGINADKVIFVSLGKLEQVTSEDVRVVIGSAISKCMGMKLDEAYVAIPSKLKLPYADVISAMLEGAYLRNYIFDKYKKDKKTKTLSKVVFVTHESDIREYEALNKKNMAICSGTLMAREWVSTPANELTPEIFANEIIDKAIDSGITINVMEEQQLADQNFNALLAVSMGSQNKPRFVIMEHNIDNTDKICVLVGKAVTFDSGGINLKTSDSLSDMKSDMSGGAAVAATMITAAKLKLPMGLVGIIPIVENMPSGSAIRPGDIVKSYNGKTIEILNTDAEGRLILADAISYAKKEYNPEMIIDLATLTGACVVALGEKFAGIFSHDKEMIEQMLKSSERTYERCWQLPMPDDYKEFLKSDFADIKNISSRRWGGAITAALFLSDFVGDTKWMHLDIAGPAYITKGDPYCPVGGTGFGVRLLCDFLQQ